MLTLDDEERLLLISLNDKVTKKESQIVLKKIGFRNKIIYFKNISVKNTQKELMI